MKQALLFCILIVLSKEHFSQTKKISFKSHSGNLSNFKTAFENKLFDTEFSNFGAAPTPIVKTAKLDSVIFISETKAVMFTSDFCHDRYEKTPTYTQWRAGKDTVTNHPLFSKQHSLDSIKTVLKTHYRFKNPVDSVKFIGFDNARKKPVPPATSSQEGSQENLLIPVSSSNDNTHTPNADKLPLLFGIITLAALFSALFSWKYRQS